MKMMKGILKIFILFVLVYGLSGCRIWRDTSYVTDVELEIFPDYKGVTVPCNIAPLNFMIEDADHVQANFMAGSDASFRIIGKDGVIAVPEKKWRELMEDSKGGTLSIEVSVWSEEWPEGVTYTPFNIYISDDEIDGWVAYRLIEPGYVGWRQLGIYQRDLTSFEETAIVTNKADDGTCLNCHNFPAFSSESMMFHARGANGGTVIYHEGKLSKVDFGDISPVKSTTYPAWHPEGDYIAYSSNTTHQIFFDEGRQPVEVFDTASDLVVYDLKNNRLITDPRFMTEETLETFPSWSPDGRYLYFSSYASDTLPVLFSTDIRYDILRVAFDPETGTLGEKIDTVFCAAEDGGSASYPRISPEGRYLLYTWSQYGTFPVWHQEADLRMLDLEEGGDADVSLWNDADQADSYHSWSSDGRWIVFGSRRLDGRYTRLFIAHLDEDGNPGKPFLLPQEDPRHNVLRMKSYNVPEFIDGKVELPREAAEIFIPKQ